MFAHLLIKNSNGTPEAVKYYHNIAQNAQINEDKFFQLNQNKM